ncbi:MAG: acyl-CoA dehydratase activase [Collinsella sp.]
MALLVGLDVGSTTTKVYAMHEDMTEAWWGYRRHGACQTASVRAMLGELAERFPHESLRVAVTGSGARDIATALGASYVQEVVANALAISRFYPQTRCAIELGGQDAKMIFFRTNDKGDIEVADMRMNGSCAGGTGAFIDEMAKLMGVGTESGEFEQLASRGTTVHEVSGRCGVYAKTDIQPLLNEGIPATDLALSALHAVARQTIGGLAQGIDIEPPVIFEGGTLAYNPTLVRVFREQLNLSDDQVIVPRDPQIMVARGAALSLTDMFASSQPIDLPDAFVRLDKLETVAPASGEGRLAQPFFATPAEQADFTARHGKETPAKGPDAYAPGETVRVALGIDSGSTTTKFALVDEAGELVDSFYASNNGRPLDVAQQGLVSLKNRWETAGVTLAIDAVGTTGYGEELFARAFHADYHTVETVAHARAACACVPDATFVLDIGGQDMKPSAQPRRADDIVVNEACSAGCAVPRGFCQTSE